MPGFDRDQVAIDNTVENRRLGSIMLTIGWILLWMDAILGIFFFSSLRDGSMFWPIWLGIEGVLGLVLVSWEPAIATRLARRGWDSATCSAPLGRSAGRRGREPGRLRRSLRAPRAEFWVVARVASRPPRAQEAAMLIGRKARKWLSSWSIGWVMVLFAFLVLFFHPAAIKLGETRFQIIAACWSRQVWCWTSLVLA